MNGSYDDGVLGESAPGYGAIGQTVDTIVHQNTTKARLERKRVQYLNQVEYCQSLVAKIDKALDVLKDNPELFTMFDSLRNVGIY